MWAWLRERWWLVAGIGVGIFVAILMILRKKPVKGVSLSTVSGLVLETQKRRAKAARETAAAKLKLDEKAREDVEAAATRLREKVSVEKELAFSEALKKVKEPGGATELMAEMLDDEE